MTKKIVIILGFIALVGGFSNNANAQRSNQGSGKKVTTARAGVGKSSTLRSGVSSLIKLTTSTTGTTTTTTTTTEDTELDALACAQNFKEKVIEAGICGNDLTKCYSNLVSGVLPLTWLAVGEKGGIVANSFENCKCGTLDCKTIALTYLSSFITDGTTTDYYVCEKSFKLCASAICNSDYSGCADVLSNKTYGLPTESTDAIATDMEELISALDAGTVSVPAVDGRLQKRLGECRTNILQKCKVGTANEQENNRNSIWVDYRDTFIKNGASALIAKYGNDAKQSVLKAYACVDDVDTCMKKNCGNDYAKCLNDDFTVNESAINNFKSLCQKELVSCAQMRALAKLEGYQYLADVKVDGAKQVWDDFITNRVKAYGNAKAVDRQKLEQELETLLSFAQKSCQDNGGQVAFIQEKLAVYDAKYSARGTDDKNDGDTGMFGVLASQGITTDAKKEDRFYSKMICRFAFAVNKLPSGKAPKFIDMGTQQTCDVSYFNVAEGLNWWKKNQGKLIGSIAGVGTGVGAGLITSGALSDKADAEGTTTTTTIDSSGKETSNTTDGTKTTGDVITNKAGQDVTFGVTGGALLGVAGYGIGSSVDQKTLDKAKKELKCLVGGKTYAITDTINVVKSSAFKDLESFYSANPELLAERGEYYNLKFGKESYTAGKDVKEPEENLFQ